MLQNYLKMAIRTLGRRKFFSFVSLFAISFTLMVLIVVTAMVDNALAPGAPEVHLDRTLHLTRMRMSGDRIRINSDPGYAFLDRYVRDIPGVELTSLHSVGNDVTSFVGGEKIVSRLKYADGTFWEILDFEFLEGGPFTADDDRAGNQVVVISRATRQRFFKGEAAVGRTIQLDGRTFQVVGVVEDVPITRAHAVSEIWAPISTTRPLDMLDRFMGGYAAILLARSPRDFDAIKAEFSSRLEHVEFPDPEMFDTARGTPMTRLETLAMAAGAHQDYSRPRIDRLFLMAALLVLAFLLLPTINLISVNMSRILERSSEIGVRKAFGAGSHHLVGQFVVENVLLCVIGGAIAFVAATAVLAWINASGIVPNAAFSVNLRVFILGLALSVLFGLLSGAYPAWRMSRLHPVEALRGGIR
jgi:putative ABC transport system permease protein